MKEGSCFIIITKFLKKLQYCHDTTKGGLYVSIDKSGCRFDIGILKGFNQCLHDQLWWNVLRKELFMLLI